MNLRKFILNELRLLEQVDDMYNAINELRGKIAVAAQGVYNQWEQDEDGNDEMYGSGGICDDIADAMCKVIYDNTNFGCFHLYNEYECHTSIFVYDEKNRKMFNVDIPPYVYENGYGYNWKKIDDVTFDTNHIKIDEVDYDDYEDLI